MGGLNSLKGGYRGEYIRFRDLGLGFRVYRFRV